MLERTFRLSSGPRLSLWGHCVEERGGSLEGFRNLRKAQGGDEVGVLGVGRAGVAHGIRAAGARVVLGAFCVLISPWETQGFDFRYKKWTC